MTLVCEKKPLASQSKSLFFLVTFPRSPQFHHEERKKSVQKFKEESRGGHNQHNFTVKSSTLLV